MRRPSFAALLVASLVALVGGARADWSADYDAKRAAEARRDQIEVAFHGAIIDGNANAVADLIAQGADATVLDLNHPDDDNAIIKSPPMHPDVMRVLLAHGAKASSYLRFKVKAFRAAQIFGWLCGPLLLVIAFFAVIQRRQAAYFATAHARATGSNQERLEVLHCAQCGAAVPLRTDEAPCPFCRAPVPVPANYAELGTRRAEEQALLRGAERSLRRARLTASPILEILWYTVGAVLFPFTLYALCSFGTDVALAAAGSATFLLAVVGGLIFALAFVFYGYYLRGARGDLRGLPRSSVVAGEPETGRCRDCDAPIDFAAGQLAVHCGYCGAETLRARVIAAARDAAEADTEAVRFSIWRFVGQLNERRTQALTSVMQGAFSVLVLCGIFSAMALKDWLSR